MCLGREGTSQQHFQNYQIGDLQTAQVIPRQRELTCDALREFILRLYTVSKSNKQVNCRLKNFKTKGITHRDVCIQSVARDRAKVYNLDKDSEFRVHVHTATMLGQTLELS